MPVSGDRRGTAALLKSMPAVGCHLELVHAAIQAEADKGMPEIVQPHLSP